MPLRSCWLLGFDVTRFIAAIVKCLAIKGDLILKIHYELTEEDYLHFNLFHVKQSKTAIKSLKIQRFITPVFFIIAAFIFSGIGDMPVVFPLIIFGLISIVWLIFYPKYFYSLVMRQSKKMLKEGKNDGLLGQQQMVLSEEGIVYLTSNGESQVKWTGIKKIVEDSDFFYLYNSSVSAYILPKRALSSVKEAEDYFSSKLVREN